MRGILLGVECLNDILMEELNGNVINLQNGGRRVKEPRLRRGNVNPSSGEFKNQRRRENIFAFKIF